MLRDAQGRLIRSAWPRSTVPVTVDWLARLAFLPPLLLGLAMVGFVGYFAPAALDRHAAFVSHAQDLGYFDQTVWASSRGWPLHLTVYDLNLTVPEHSSFLAYHVELLLLLVAPLYWLWDDVRALLILQPIVLALAAVPAYGLGRHYLGGRWGGLAIGLLVLLNPTIQAAPVNDFHTLAFAPLLLLCALLALAQRRWLTLLAWCGLAILIKEQISLLIAMLGLAVVADGLRHRWPGGRRQALVGGGLLVGGAAWFLVSVLIVIPAFVGHRASESPFVARYGQYGDGLGGMLRTFLTRPDIVWLLTPKWEIADYWLTLALGGGLLPLVSPLALLMAPELAINSLSSFVAQRASATHYSLSLVAFVVVAAADGLARLGRWLGGRVPLTGCLVVAALVIAVLNSIDAGFLPGARKYRLFQPGERQAEAAAFFALLPPDEPITVQENLVPQLTHRLHIYPFAYGFTPPRLGDDPIPEWVLMDVTAAPSRIDGRSLEREVYSDPDYGVVAADNGYLLLRRGVSERRLPADFTRFALAATDEVDWPAPIRSGDGRLAHLATTVDWQPDPWSRRGWKASIVSYWRAERELSDDLRFTVTDTAASGGPLFARSPTEIWLPSSRWPVGQIIRIVHGTVDLNRPRALTLAAVEPAASSPLLAVEVVLRPPATGGLAGLMDGAATWLSERIMAGW